MQIGDKTGDGKTSPFGGGSAGSGIGVQMSGNNFVTNPRGNPSGPKSIPVLINNSRTQTSKPSDVSTRDAAPGGLIPTAAPPATRPGGVGTVGNSAKPFRLGGG